MVYATADVDLTDFSQIRDASSLRFLIVLESVDAATLDQLSIGYKKIPGYQGLKPMVMTPEEMRSSTDVFPITFLEMKRNYRVLTGKDILADLPIGFIHLRLRCEQELKNLLLRMQSRYLTQHDDRRLHQSLKADFRSFMRSVGAASLLFDKEFPANDKETIATSAELLDLDQNLLERVSEICLSETKLGAEKLRATYATLISCVSNAAQFIDQIPERVSVIDVIEDEGGRE